MKDANEQVILDLVNNCLTEDGLSYTAFDKIFGFLKKDEQYVIVNVLSSHGIDLYDDENENADEDFKKITDEVISKYIGKTYEDDYRDVRFISQSNENLCGLIQSGNEEAKNQLCIKNKRLVYKYAIYYHGCYNCKLDVDDLVQAGMMGMLIAAEKYDVKTGFTFSTYAVNWIKSKIRRVIADEGYTVRLPVHVFDKIAQIKREIERCDNGNLSRKELVGKVASNLVMTESDVEKYLTIDEKYMSIISLDKSVGENGESSLKDFVADSMILTPDEAVINGFAEEIVAKMLGKLSTRERTVMILRYGLDESDPMTLEQVGVKLGVTRERIRQIEYNAKRKLLGSSLSKTFWGIYE